MKARFDAASNTGENQNHWLSADSLSADAAANYEIRKRLRERSRYETSNNCYAFGVLETIADYTVGSGARLQLLCEDKKLNAQIEEDFAQWAEMVNLGELLRIARIARCRDGEVFIKLGNNPKLKNTDIKLDITLIEADCVTNQNVFGEKNFIDGIVLSNEYYWGLKKNSTLYTAGNDSYAGFRELVEPTEAEVLAYAESVWAPTQEAVATQLWINHSFMNELEAWNVVRRTGYPTVNFTRDTQITAYPTPPHRLPYTSNELSYNSENCQAAISKNYTEDTGYYTKLFWAKDNYYTLVK